MICEKSLFHEKADNLPLNSVYGKGHDHEKFANLRNWLSHSRICELFCWGYSYYAESQCYFLNVFRESLFHSFGLILSRSPFLAHRLKEKALFPHFLRFFY